jgi:PAS domain S-box-containing protein
MWVVDAESFAFLAVNDAAVRHYGYSRGEFLAMTASDVRPPEEVPRFMEHAAKAPTGLTQAGIRRHRKKDGSVMDVEVASDELVFEGRNAWLVVLNDVTERERTNDALQARIRQQAAVADLGQRALEVADLPSLLSDAAVVVSRTLGVDLCGIFEQSPDRRELVLRAGVGWPAEMIGRARIGAGSGSQGGFTLLAGEPVILEDLATEARFSPSRLLTDHGVVSGVSVAIPGGDQPFGVLEAHTTRRRVFTTDDVHFLRAIANVLAAAILRRREDDVRRQLLERVMWAQEDERRRIALELHDETGQALASLLVGLRAVADEPSLPKVKGQTERLRWLVAGTMDGLSRLARGLHPTVLRDLGLVPALSRYAAEHGQLLGISIAVDAEGVDGQRLTPAVEISLYRIAQEALANVGKHASARHARVLLRREDSTVRLVVEDDGEGFAVGEVLRSAVRSGHLGLHGIRERAAVLGGRAEIDSSPGRGTRVSVSVPLTSVSRGRRKRAASR